MPSALGEHNLPSHASEVLTSLESLQKALENGKQLNLVYFCFHTSLTLKD